jgi:hypothetical protein
MMLLEVCVPPNCVGVDRRMRTRKRLWISLSTAKSELSSLCTVPGGPLSVLCFSGLFELSLYRDTVGPPK